jgi:predicted metal-binding protein
MTTLFVCITCKGSVAPTGDDVPPDAIRPGARFYEALKARGGIDVVPVECLSNCTRSCTAAVSAPGKWTYVVGHLDPDLHVDDMLSFARLHDATADGLTVWRERPEHVRKNTIARVPPVPTVPASKVPA